MISSNYNNIKSSIYNASTNDTTKVSANKQVKEKASDTSLATSKYEGYGVDKDGFFTSDFNEAAGIPSDFKIHKNSMSSLVNMEENMDSSYRTFAKIDIAKTARNAYKVLSQVAPDIANSDKTYFSNDELKQIPQGVRIDIYTLDVKKLLNNPADFKEGRTGDKIVDIDLIPQDGILGNNNGGKAGKFWFDTNASAYKNENGEISKGGLLVSMIAGTSHLRDGITTINGKLEGYDKNAGQEVTKSLQAWMARIKAMAPTSVTYGTGHVLFVPELAMKGEYTDIEEFKRDYAKVMLAPANTSQNEIRSMVEEMIQKQREKLSQTLAGAFGETIKTGIDIKA